MLLVKESEISLKFLKLFLECDIEEIELVLKVIEEQLIFYIQEIEGLDKTKPFFFQTKKLEEYYRKRNDYHIKIWNLNLEKKNNELRIEKLRGILNGRLLS